MKQSCHSGKLSSIQSNFWIKFSFGLMLFLYCSALYSQSRMSEKEAFFYTIATNSYSLTETGYGNGVQHLVWRDLYAEYFDKTNFRNTLNDEFKRQPYKTKITSELQKQISDLDFNKTFYFTSRASFEKYNMDLGLFPIYGKDILRNLAYIIHQDEYNMFFSIGEVFNFNDFDFVLKMDPSKAESFVNSKKDVDGKISRNVDVKVIYNVVNKNQTIKRDINKVYFGIYIQKILFMNGSTILGEIKPKVDYYDKANLIKDKPQEGVTVKDIDGNVYHTVTIGKQVWMVENLKTTKYNDGTDIPLIRDNKLWSDLTSPGYCWYNNNHNNTKTYGALYNWYTVNTGKLCPIGWHVPSEIEWTILLDFLKNNGYSVSKAMAASTGWPESSFEGTIGNSQWSNNKSGFSALPGGSRAFNGEFYRVGEFAEFWSSTIDTTTFTGDNIKFNGKVAKSLSLDPHVADKYLMVSGLSIMLGGHSVRCLKD